MNISAQDVINAIFHPDDTVCLRIFDDRKEGIFTGAKMSVEAGKFFAVESTLKEHNPVSYTHLTLPTKIVACRSRWSPYH